MFLLYLIIVYQDSLRNVSESVLIYDPIISIHALEKLTGKKFTSLNIVGGGCQDNYLNKVTEKMTGLSVYAGPVEGTAIGNLLVQMIAGGELKDLQEAREVIRRSFDVREIKEESTCL